VTAVLLATGLALWLGILTSISPCPLATNIAAITYVGRRVDQPRLVFAAGLLYTLGRIITYVALGVVIVSGLLAIPQVSQVLQYYMHRLLGPVLIVAGMFLLELIAVKFHGAGVSTRLQQQADRAGIWGALILGLVFALTFCPTSAALFFGSLIPLSVEHSSRVTLPLIYGLGTALPVVVFAVLIAVSTQLVSRAFNALSMVERWARRITGLVFIVVGIYFCLHYIYGVL